MGRSRGTLNKEESAQADTPPQPYLKKNWKFYGVGINQSKLEYQYTLICRIAQSQREFQWLLGRQKHNLGALASAVR